MLWLYLFWHSTVPVESKKWNDLSFANFHVWWRLLSKSFAKTSATNLLFTWMRILFSVGLFAFSFKRKYLRKTSFWEFLTALFNNKKLHTKISRPFCKPHPSLESNFFVLIGLLLLYWTKSSYFKSQHLNCWPYNCSQDDSTHRSNFCMLSANAARADCGAVLKYRHGNYSKYAPRGHTY